MIYASADGAVAERNVIVRAEYHQHNHLPPSERKLLLPHAKNVKHNLPQSNLYFTGRDDYIREIASTLTVTHKKTKNKVSYTVLCSLSGLGGIGKTALAIEYAYLNFNKYRLIWILRAETPQTLKNDFIELGAEIGVQVNLLDELEVIPAIKNFIERLGKWLLVFDNADPKDAKVLEKYYPNMNGDVLITSRDRLWHGFHKKIEVDVLDIESATLCFLKIIFEDKLIKLSNKKNKHEVQLFLRKLKINELKPIITEKELYEIRGFILNSLQCLTLAVMQAAYYIRDTQCGITDYIDRFKKYTRELLSKNSNLTDYDLSVAASLGISLDKITESNTNCINTLRFFSFINPDRISRDLLREWVILEHSLTGVELDNVIIEFNRNSIVSFPDNATINIHRLVQENIRMKMNKEETIVFLNKIINFFKKCIANRSALDILPHVLELTKWVDQYSCYNADLEQVLLKMAERYFNSGHYNYAVQLLEKALVVQSNFYKTEVNKRIAETYVKLSDALYKSNNLKRLRDTLGLMDALETKGQMSDDYLIDCATLMGLLEYREDNYQKSLDLFEKVLKLAHTDNTDRRLNTLRNMGRNFYMMGDNVKAKEFLNRALGVAYSLYPSKENKLVANIFRWLGKVEYRFCKYNQAKILFEEALRIHRKSLPPTHPEIGRELVWLGHVCYRKHLHDEGLQYYRETVILQERMYGTQFHPYVVAAIYSQGHINYEMGNYRAAHDIYVNALDLNLQIYGNRHDNPRIARNLNRIGNALLKLGNIGAAQIKFEESLGIFKKKYKTFYHPRVAMAFLCIGVCYFERDKLHDAVMLFFKVFEIQSNVYDNCYHRDVLSTLFYYSDYLIKLNKSIEAKLVLQTILTIQCTMYEDGHHPRIAFSLNKLAEVFLNLGDYQQALFCVNQSLNILMEIFKTDKCLIVKEALSIKNNITMRDRLNRQLSILTCKKRKPKEMNIHSLSFIKVPDYNSNVILFTIAELNKIFLNSKKNRLSTEAELEKSGKTKLEHVVINSLTINNPSSFIAQSIGSRL